MREDEERKIYLFTRSDAKHLGKDKRKKKVGKKKPHLSLLDRSGKLAKRRRRRAKKKTKKGIDKGERKFYL